MSNSGTFLLIKNDIPNCYELTKSVKNSYLLIDKFDTINDIDLFFSNTDLSNINYFGFVYSNNIIMPFFSTDTEYFGELCNYFLTKLVSLNNNIIIDFITANMNEEKIDILKNNFAVHFRYSLSHRKPYTDVSSSPLIQNSTGSITYLMSNTDNNIFTLVENSLDISANTLIENNTDISENYDWILESDNVSIKDLYFNENINNVWTYKSSPPMPNFRNVILLSKNLFNLDQLKKLIKYTYFVIDNFDSTTDIDTFFVDNNDSLLNLGYFAFMYEVSFFQSESLFDYFVNKLVSINSNIIIDVLTNNNTSQKSINVRYSSSDNWYIVDNNISIKNIYFHEAIDNWTFFATTTNYTSFVLLNTFAPGLIQLTKSLKSIYYIIESFNNYSEIDTFFNENNKILLNISYFGVLYENDTFTIPFFKNDNEYFGDLFTYFLTKLVSLNNTIIIDIITCDINKEEHIEKLDILKSNLNINIRYSLNQTGDYNLGGDWIMESDNINIKDLYFNENINDWHYTLWIQGYSSGLYRYIIDISGNRVYTHHDISGNELTSLYDSNGYIIKYTPGRIVLGLNIPSITSAISNQLQSGCVAVLGTRTLNGNNFIVLKSDGSVVTCGAGITITNTVSSQLSSNVASIYATNRAFAALKNDGSVVAWGDAIPGGDASTVSARLQSGVKMIYAGNNVFYAVKTDGSLVPWGQSSLLSNNATISSQIQSGVVTVYPTNIGCVILKNTGGLVFLGDSANVTVFNTFSAQLQSGVNVVYTAYNGGFAALKSTGNVVAWGSTGFTVATTISAQLQSNIKMIYSNDSAFAALKTTGNVITWGNTAYGGSMTTPVNVSAQLQSNVAAIYSTSTAFAALKTNGSVVTWGESANGGSFLSISAQLQSNVKAIYSGRVAFAALKNDGTVIAWGDSTYGGSSSSVSSSLINVSTIYSAETALIAQTSTNNIVVWGAVDGLSTTTWPVIPKNTYRTIGTVNTGIMAIAEINNSYSTTLILKLDANIFSALPNNTAMSAWGSTGVPTMPTYITSGTSTIKTNALNGMPVVQYLAGSSNKHTITNFTLSNPLYCTVFVLYGIPSGTTGDLAMELNSNYDQPGFYIDSIAYYYANICPTFGSVNSIGLPPSLAPTPGSYGLQCLVSADPANNFNLTVYMNGSYVVSNTSEMRYLPSDGSVTSQLNINCRNGGAAAPFPSNINIAEIRIYNSALSQSDRQAVEAEMMWKWGIQSQLPVSHPYYSINRYSFVQEQSTLIFRLDASTLNLANGAAVTSWMSTSPMTLYYASPSNNTPAPTYITNGLNGRGIVSFNSGSIYQIPNVSLSNSSIFTIFLLYSPINQSTECPWIEYGENVGYFGGQLDFFVHTGNISSSGYQVFIGNSGYVIGNAVSNYTAAQNTWQLLEIVSNGPTLLELYTNGTLRTSTINGTTANVSNAVNQTKTLYLNGRSLTSTGDGTQSYANRIADFMIFNSAFSITERQKVEGDIMTKWNLRNLLPTNHPSYAPLTNNVSSLLFRLDSSTLSLSNGASVSTWASPVGSYTGAPANSTTAPTYITNGLNGRGIVSFNSGNIYRIPSVALTQQNLFTLFLLYKPVNHSTNSPFIEYGTSAWSNYGEWYIQTGREAFANGGGDVYYNSTVTYIAGYDVGSNITAPQNTWQLLTITDGGNNDLYIWYINGKQVYMAVAGTTVASYTKDIYLNGRSSISPSYSPTTLSYNCQIAEFMLFNRALTTTERQNVEGDLMNKWGLTSLLPQTHPFYAEKTLTGGITITQNIPIISATSNLSYNTNNAITLSYQWQVSDTLSGVYTNIGSATSSTFTQTGSQTNKYIMCRTTHTNEIDSSQVIVNSNILGPLLGLNSGPTGSVIITGTATQYQTLGLTNTISDADGISGILAYQWYRGTTSGTIITQLGTAITQVLSQSEVSRYIQVNVTYTDNRGVTSTVCSNIVGPVANVNESPSGNITVSGLFVSYTPPRQNQLLTIYLNFTDLDGIPNTTINGVTGFVVPSNFNAFTAEWFRADDTSNANITPITGYNYLFFDSYYYNYDIVQADVGKYIKAKLTYVDNFGTTQSLESAYVGPISNVDDAPTGSIVITGTPTQYQTLSITNTIVDLDGISGGFSYQWYQGVATNTITTQLGTAATQVLSQTQVSRYIQVVVTYTDNFGVFNTVCSNIVGPVANIPDSPSGTIVISGTPTQYQTLSITNTICDLDGISGPLSYQWYRGTASGTITTQLGTATTQVLSQAEVSRYIQVVITYTDNFGLLTTVCSNIVGPVANIPDSPSGSIVISGVATQYQTLSITNTICDLDGISGSLSYQWYRGTSSGTITTQLGTISTQVLSQSEVNQYIQVIVTFTDTFGVFNTVCSNIVGPVANIPDSPSGSIIITGTPTQYQLLSITNTIVDLDGISGGFGYQWYQGTTSSTINTLFSTSGLITLTQSQVSRYIQVNVTYTDNFGVFNTVCSNIVGPVANVNDLPTFTILGSLIENATLTASISDIDGVSGIIAYQWSECAIFNGSYTNIAGATANTYLLTHTQVSRYIKVVVSYTDNSGTAESIASNFVGPIANITNPITGNAIIYGTTQQYQILTVSNTLTSLDGLLFTYTWYQSSTSGGVYTQI